jgi:hypothetical protein
LLLVILDQLKVLQVPTAAPPTARPQSADQTITSMAKYTVQGRATTAGYVDQQLMTT